MNTEIDEPMKLGPNDCPRCGMPKSYHKTIIDGKIYMPCIRKKPYKLADGTDIHIGMQVWNVDERKNYKIITGMVRFIHRWGSISLWKYPEERIPEKYKMSDGRVIDLPGKLNHEGHYSARHLCFSSLKNAEVAIEKLKKEKAELEKWRQKHKHK